MKNQKSTQQSPECREPMALNASAGSVECPIESLKLAVVHHCRDWSTNKRDAWIYGIVCGWDGDDDLDAMSEVAKDHKWDAKTAARLRRLRTAFISLPNDKDEHE